MMYAHEEYKRNDDANQPFIQGSESMVKVSRGEVQRGRIAFLVIALILSLTMNAWWLLVDREFDAPSKKPTPSKIFSAQRSPYSTFFLIL